MYNYFVKAPRFSNTPPNSLPQTRKGKRSISQYAVTGGITLGALIVASAFVLPYLATYEEPQVIDTVVAFPVGVDPRFKIIEEDPNIEQFFPDDYNTPVATVLYAAQRVLGMGLTSFGDIASRFGFASADTAYVRIQPGYRKEEAVRAFSRALGWTREEEKQFTGLVNVPPVLAEGQFTPGMYIVSGDTDPFALKSIILKRFEDDISIRYTNDVAERVPMQDALTIASLLERETKDPQEMRMISGIIWNRLFVNMPLQIDATLQYVKSTGKNGNWWPVPRPRDKYLSSPYNTYANKGLPPTPISSPSVSAVLAALNPKKTDCVYYFHDSFGGFQCSVTYTDHVKSLKKYYGRGR